MTRPKCSWVLLLALAAASSLTAAEITPSPALTSSPSGTTTTGPSIVGDWVGQRVSDTVSVSFKEDGTFLMTGEAKDRSVALRGKYRIDFTSKPSRVDLFEINPPTESGDAMNGIFELQPDGRLKLDLSDEYRKKPGQGFTSGAVVFSKATSPIVAPPEKKPGAPDSSITGDWTSTAPGGRVISFSFKEDGTLLWVIEAEKAAKSTHAKYRLDASTEPKIIEMFEFEEGDNKGERLRGVFELQSDGRLKLDFVKDPKAPALKDFSKDALVFSKATSPVVRPNKPAAPTSTP